MLGELLLNLVRGRAIGRIVGEQLADQLSQRLAVVKAGSERFVVQPVGLACQEPGEQGTQAVEVGGSEGGQATAGPGFAAGVADARLVADSTGKPTRAPVKSSLG